VRLTFIRHAQPAWARDGLGVNDPPLTPLGRTQAARLHARFAGQRAHRLLVSDLHRARETVLPVADALGLEPEVLPWLGEIEAPQWDGTPIEEVERIFREHRGQPLDVLWEGLEGGESFHDFHRRVTQGLQGLLDEGGNARVHDDPALWQIADPDQHVVVVAHAGTNAAAIGYLLGIAPVPWEWERFVALHASVSVVEPFEVSGRFAYRLLRFADVGHLPPGLHTR